MTKAELLTKVQAKDGFVAILKDEQVPDSPDGAKRKRYLLVETENQDGTKGVYNVTYILDIETDTAWFYNVEPLSFEKEAKSVDVQTIEALQDYCRANFQAFFLLPDRIDPVNKWAVVEAYVLVVCKLEKKLVMVYKKGTNPIAHLEIV